MTELSEEMKGVLITGISSNAMEIMGYVNSHTSGFNKIGSQELEHLAYVTEELRLKLKMLGAPRIYN